MISSTPETIEQWLDGYRQRRRPGYKTDDEFEQHMRVLFRVSGYVKLRGWKREDLDVMLEAVRGQPVPEPEPPRPREEQADPRHEALELPQVPAPGPEATAWPTTPARAPRRSPKVKYCTEPGCRRRLPDYRTRAGLCPHHQKIRRRATWRNQKRQQRMKEKLTVGGLSYI